MQVSYSKLSVGLTVWYGYKGHTPSGPYKIARMYRGHNGQVVVLRGIHQMRDEVRDVTLADDDDFGSPIFYDDPPSAD